MQRNSITCSGHLMENASPQLVQMGPCKSGMHWMEITFSFTANILGLCLP